MDNDHFDLIYGEIFGSKPAKTQSNSQSLLGKRPQSSVSKDKKSSADAPKQPEKKVQKLSTKNSVTDPVTNTQVTGVDKNTKRALKVFRKVGDKEWIDETLADWPENDFRIYCCNLGNEVTDEVLAGAFRKYLSFSKSKIIRDKKTQKSMGYGFVSLLG